MKDNSNGARRVLLVEDEMILGRMLQRMLADLGYTVFDTATTVGEAMGTISSEGIDAAVLDINLDGEMSYPVARELISRGIPFVFSTGYGGEDLPEAYQGCRVLKKPFRRSGLGEVLTELLDTTQPAAGYEGESATRQSISAPQRKEA